jgi:hypothetical protein
LKASGLLVLVASTDGHCYRLLYLVGEIIVAPAGAFGIGSVMIPSRSVGFKGVRAVVINCVNSELPSGDPQHLPMLPAVPAQSLSVCWWPAKPLGVSLPLSAANRVSR